MPLVISVYAELWDIAMFNQRLLPETEARSNTCIVHERLYRHEARYPAVVSKRKTTTLRISIRFNKIAICNLPGLQLRKLRDQKCA